jgi:hypothetical protein
MFFSSTKSENKREVGRRGEWGGGGRWPKPCIHVSKCKSDKRNLKNLKIASLLNMHIVMHAVQYSMTILKIAFTSY